MNDTSEIRCIRRYYYPNEAVIDAGLLEAGGIESQITGSTVGTVLFFHLQQPPIQLWVREEDAEKALALLPESTPGEE